MNRVGLLAALDDGNVRAFLRVIREGESSQDASAYTICYGGSHFSAPPWDHPRKPITAGAWTSTAAGAYQFLSKTWDAVSSAYALEDFSPGNQDLAAVALIHGRKALEDVKAGRFEDAIRKCAKEWASLPFSPYGQPTMTLDEALLVYKAWGGKVAEPVKPSMWDIFDPDSLATEHYGTEAPMAPIILPLIQAAASLIPMLAEKFGSGSEVANRNIAAAKVLGEEIVKATKTPNLEAAIYKMQAEPEALAAAKAAVANVYPELFEVGGGAVEARKAASSTDQIDWWRNPAVIVAILVLPLVYMVVSAVVFGIGGQAWSDDVKTLTVTAILSGALGSITGFFLGSSLGSQRKTSMLGKE